MMLCLKEELLSKEKPFGDFLKAFNSLKLESDDVAKSVDETGDLSNAPVRSMYREQLESAINRLGLTMDDYLQAQSVWSGDAAPDEKADADESTIEQEFAKLGLSDKEIEDVNKAASSQMGTIALKFFLLILEKVRMKESLTKKRDLLAQLLSTNFDAISSEQGKYQEILEDIRRDTEYIQEIPKWQIEMQKRLEMLKQMRKRRVAELSASYQQETNQSEALEKSPTLPTDDDEGGENA
ncbi:unnamed protein product [Hydatigera taeniaeformis]|uniref:Mediator of RNA polymerase II transcription subunit 9 n=1 Tax=Hydatigena taeniaeformis TaxID=6205 RepID=A0A0R3X529_HYDTA|nr:unnamed protein product [Hydatigera taeniaeformis]